MRGHSRSAARVGRGAITFSVAIAIVLFVLIAGGKVAWAQPDQPTLRLRIAFGGGQARTWHGDITLSEGRFDRPVLLGLQADEPGSMQISEKRIAIRQPSVRDYDGLDISVHAPLSATLLVRLLDPLDAEISRTFRIALKDVISGAQPAGEPAASQLDETGNRLVVRRSPGDQLRVLTPAEHFVFSPGETFRFRVAPHMLPAQAGAALQVQLKIASRLNGREFFSQQANIVLDESLSAATLGPYEFEIPPGDDCYQLTITATQKGLLNSAIRSSVIATRQLQLVAIDANSQLNVDMDGSPREVDTLDPTRPQWQERVARLPLVRHLPRLRQGPLTHGEAQIITRDDHRWIRLAPDAWQAFPLSVGDTSRPHVIEVEYPTDRAQTLGISIVEPNAIGEVVPIGVDSGVEVTMRDVGHGPSVGKHRLTFWPKTNTPVVLVKSHDPKRAAAFGQIRVLEYPSRLPAAQTLDRQRPRRTVATWYEKPLFIENFGSPDARDENTGRSLDDWRTFYLGGSRLVESLRHAGLNSAMLAVYSDGSTIYPSQHLQPGPKYDTGIFLTSGEDPTRKDGLEMLMRLFDREGLTLIPTLQFNAPLPELEALRALGGNDREGLEPVDRYGNLWRSVHVGGDGLGVYYNTLDPRVQQAMRQVVAELVDRYGHHPSFGGVSVQLSPQGFAMLPGPGWGFDDRTFARFVKEAGVADVGANVDGRRRFAERAAWCQGPGRQSWQAWRTQQMTALYQAMADEVASAGEGATLYLTGAEMFNHEPILRLLRPQINPRKDLPEAVAAALLEVGLDLPALSQAANLAVVTPNAPVPREPVGEPLDWHSLRGSELFASLPQHGGLAYRAPVTGPVPTFDAQSPFGADQTHTWLTAQVSSSGLSARREVIEALAKEDLTSWAVGGWMMPLGQEDAQRDLFATLADLPPEKFSTVTTDDPGNQPLVMRSLQFDGQTFVYVVNQSPEPVSALVAVDTSWRTPVVGLGGREVPSLVQSSIGATLPLELKPLDLVGFVIDQTNVKATLQEVTTSDAIEHQVEQQLEDLRRRAAALGTPHEVPGPLNSDFELAVQNDGKITGWQRHSTGRGLTVNLANISHQGGHQSLRLTSEGAVCWIRSEPISVPATGRIAVWVWLRKRDGTPQPPLRLAIEGQYKGESYYRYAHVGANVESANIGDAWAPFVLQISDLPRQGLTDLRIGFDMMGAGEVFIDDIQVFDLSFTSGELTELRKSLTTADFLLRKDHQAAAALLLDEHWMRFLQQHVTPTAVSTQASEEDNLLREARRRTRERMRSVPRPQSMIERFKGWVPSSPF